jgi:hypothetical protein
MTPRRKKVALAIAALADAVQLGFFPVFGGGGLSVPDDVLDFVVAVALVIALGWRWRLVAALALELVPGVALFPSWTAFVATLPASAEAPRLPSGAPAAADPDSTSPS